MAKKLGYGGIANTNGARSFADKEDSLGQAARKLGYGGLGNTAGARDFSSKAALVSFQPALIGYIQRSYIRSLLGR